MPIRSEWKLAREGWTFDTTLRLLQHSVLNPLTTLPLLLAAHYSPHAAQFAARHPDALRALKALLGLGLLRIVGRWLDDQVINNWQRDTWNWADELVVVTGGADGIGRSIVLLLAEQGIKVAVLDVQKLTYEAPPSVHYFACDLASKPAIVAAAERIKLELGNPTVLINNAGCARGKTILDTTENDIRLTFNVNTLAHFFLTQQFLPAMIERNHGMVVTVASMAAYVTAPNMVEYAASKAAALAFHEGLAGELVSRYNAPRVRTVLMCQGYTRTALFEGYSGPALHPDTVADEIVKAVLRGRSAHLVMPLSLAAIVPLLRGWPVWMQYGVRKETLKHVMSGWKGRQVVQPSEAKEKRIDESAVLVESQ